MSCMDTLEDIDSNKKQTALTQSELKSERKSENTLRMVDVIRDKPIKVSVKVAVPVRDHPKGNSLKRLQEETITKMAILGRGSMRDKSKEDKLRNSGDSKFAHLKDDLHVEITAFAPAAEAHARIAYALTEVRRFLVPDYNDEIRQEQMWEMQVLQKSGFSTDATDSETGESRSSLHSMDDNLQNDCSTQPISECSPVHIKHSADQTLIRISETPGRKRPLLTGGESSKVAMSPSKRTVMAILARARTAQVHAKDMVTLTPHLNGLIRTDVSGLREKPFISSNNLLFN
ncbi:KH domain-containing, RNA-binding, signal transduction-associated protein 1-like isoform X2 [Adelges cooleyi]|uniref:KH domain-containing, RNA-binding, signal transduction-associated protein 1-like isoform X2 n=1 Tax=Adelges cooleyi TaxID=133065 RepID=UPI00217FD71D|nr:KH domain-containing, RNA-binding, signal transduction-associated protein 1-like isoform X2 [Adelges cooleyi]